MGTKSTKKPRCFFDSVKSVLAQNKQLADKESSDEELSSDEEYSDEEQCANKRQRSHKKGKEPPLSATLHSRKHVVIWRRP